MVSPLQGAVLCRAARSPPQWWLSAKGSSRGRAPSRELLKKEAASGDSLSPSFEWLFPALGKDDGLLTTASACLSHVGHHVTVLPKKGVQGECFPPHMQHPSPLRERLPFPPPRQPPPLFPWLPWEATGHLFGAAAGPNALFCPQAVHGKATIAPGGQALRGAEQSYLQSGQGLLVVRGSPVKKSTGISGTVFP